MITPAFLDEVLETIFVVILALNLPVTECLAVAGVYGMQAASKPSARRLFGAFILLAFCLLAVITMPTDLFLESKPTNPYDLLGVKTTSSTGTITTAYNNLV